MDYSFGERNGWSKGIVGATCVDTIRSILAGCVSVRKSDLKQDKLGVDYIATLRRGAEVFIDHKARDKGSSKYWKGEPELALEIWSVMPRGGRAGKCGWTLDEAKVTDYTLHTFHPSECESVYLLPFQLLRMAFRDNLDAWCATYKRGMQCSGAWYSECVFVPASVVLKGIEEAMVIQPVEAVA